MRNVKYLYLKIYLFHWAKFNAIAILVGHSITNLNYINYLVAILASTGVVLCAAYMLWMAKRVVFGKTKNDTISTLKDINYLEGSMLIILCLVSLVFGFYPEPLLNTMDVSVNGIVENHQNELTVNLINRN